MKARAYIVRFDDVEAGKPHPTRFALARGPRAALAAVGRGMLPDGWLSGNFTISTLRHGEAIDSHRLYARGYMLVCKREISRIERNAS